MKFALGAATLVLLAGCVSAIVIYEDADFPCNNSSIRLWVFNYDHENCKYANEAKGDYLEEKHSE